MATTVDDAVASDSPLRTASVDRLASLVRHWAWADEAMTRFDRELATGRRSGDGSAVDPPPGAFYHWCALLSGFGEAALTDQFLSSSQLATIRPDLDASLPDLHACRGLLMAVPSSLEAHPPAIDRLRDQARLERLRRLHLAFGDAIRNERVAREIDLLDD